MSRAQKDRANERRRERYATDPEYKKNRTKWTKTNYKRGRRKPATWLARRIYILKSRAKKLGVAFNLTAADIAAPELCPILGVPLIFGGGVNHPHGPSVDRIIPALGYVKGNIRIISFLANSLKRDCDDPAVFRAIADYLEGRR